jgi:hypothetical protein
MQVTLMKSEISELSHSVSVNVTDTECDNSEISILINVTCIVVPYAILENHVLYSLTMG